MNEVLHEREQVFNIDGPIEGISLFLRRLTRRDETRPSAGLVLYVHGATFPSALSIAYPFPGGSWRDALCAACFDVWAFDFYGFGESAHYPEQSQPAEANSPLGLATKAAEQLQRVVSFVLEHECAARLSVISHSWGSLPVGVFANEHPSWLDRWVMFAPISMRPARRYETPALAPAWKAISLEDQWARFVEDVPAGATPVLSRDEFDAWGLAYLDTDSGSRQRDPAAVNVPLGPFSEVIAAWHGRFPYDPAKVVSPIAIIRGEWDGLMTDADARWLFDAMVNASEKRDIKISRGTHLMHLETMRHALWRESIAFLTP